MDRDLKVKVEVFRESISKEAEELVNNFFPQKCLELDTFLKGENFQLEHITKIHEPLNLAIPEPLVVTNTSKNGPDPKKRKVDEQGDSNSAPSATSTPGSKIFVFPNGPVPSNAKLLKIINHLKPEVRTIVEKCNTVRMWVTLLIPKIEDGNNFGVQIQEETLGELRSVESESASFLDQISKYFLTRGQIIAKAAKYPHVDDYRQFIIELDEKQFLSLRLIAAELRNHYSVLHDMILKNIEKIKKPRTSNMDGMY